MFSTICNNVNINYCILPKIYDVLINYRLFLRFALFYLPELRNRGLFVMLNAKLRNIDIARTLLDDEEPFAKCIKTSRASVA